MPGRNVVHPPLVIYLWKQSSQLHIKVQHKTMVDRSIVAWEKVAAEKRSVDGAPRALSRHKGAIVVWLCFPMLWCLLSSLSFLPITQPPIRRPPLWPSHWLLRIARKWMNVVEYKEGAMRDGPQDALSRSARIDDG